MRMEAEAFDARAEGARRRIEVTPQSVVISRRIAGVDMRIALAPQQYRGVALTVLVAELCDFLYQVKLVHADADLDVTLASFGDEAEARAAWRQWASALRLSRLVERSDASYEIDGAPTRSPIERRRGRATLRRRNRFLARRKMGRPAPPCALGA
jgi:hypothetical protein